MSCKCQTKEEHAQRAVEAATYTSQQDAQQRDKENADRIQELRRRTPNPDEYTVEEVEQVGSHLVIKVRYPGCEKCDFDRCKVMVYLHVPIKDAMKWRRIDPHFIDPHFRAPKAGTVLRHEAPSPAARFPGSPEGWSDALEYAGRKEDVH
jgi:hypothetical protein